jgi:hypothetical protein
MGISPAVPDRTELPKLTDTPTAALLGTSPARRRHELLVSLLRFLSFLFSILYFFSIISFFPFLLLLLPSSFSSPFIFLYF